MKGEYVSPRDPGPMYYSGLAMEIGFALEDSAIRSVSDHRVAVREGWRWLRAGHQFAEMCRVGPVRADVRLAEAWGSIQYPFTSHSFAGTEDYQKVLAFRNAAIQSLAYLRGLTEVAPTAEQQQIALSGFTRLRHFYHQKAVAQLTAHAHWPAVLVG